MKLHNRFQRGQRKFLQDLRDSSEELLPAILKKLNIERPRFDQWMQNKHFNRAVTKVMKGKERSAVLETDIAADIVRQLSAAGVVKGLEPNQRIHYKNMIDLSHRDRRVRAKKKSSALAPPSPIHPNFAGETEQMLKVLEG